jgi:protein associated with RNAse G/E
MAEPITVRVLKHDGAEHRRWTAKLKSREGELIVLDAEFEVEVTHESLGAIPKGTRTIEYYWLNRWYNVFQFLHNDGSTRLFYCNINTPPAMEDNVITYVDLDIDLLIGPDLSYKVLDLEEFRANAQLYQYSDETRQNARAAVEELKQMIERRQFPFGGELSCF